MTKMTGEDTHQLAISFIKQLSFPVAPNKHKVRLSSDMNWPILQWNQRLFDNVEVK